MVVIAIIIIFIVKIYYNRDSSLTLKGMLWRYCEDECDCVNNKSSLVKTSLIIIFLVTLKKIANLSKVECVFVSVQNCSVS